jgi:ATP-dependent DNA helicase RecG
MNLAKIKKIVMQGESDSVEFKKTTGQLRSAFETVCAFLNGEGGIVLIGVGDKGKIIGQEISDRTRQEIANTISELEPPAQSQININYVKLDKEKHIIAIKVNAGNHIPYAFEGRAFQRIQSTTSRMPQHMYEQLIIKRGQLNHSWETLPANRGFDILSLDHEEIRRTVDQGIRFNRIPPEAANEDIESLLTRLKLLQDGQLNNAAIVLFGKELFPDYAQC